MMKKSSLLTRALALSLVMALMFAMSIGAYDVQPQAAIVIQNDSETTSVSIIDKVYEAYKVFDAKVIDDKNGGDDSMEYYVNADFIAFFENILTGTYDHEHNNFDSENTAFNHEAQEYINSIKNDSQAMAEFTKSLREYVIDDNITPAATADEYNKSGDIETIRTPNIDPAYYLVLDTDDRVEDSFASAGMLVSLPNRDTDGTLSANVFINIKGSVPTIDKSIWHNDKTNANGDTSLIHDNKGSWDIVGDHQIGDKVEFLVTCTMPYNLAGYDEYTYILEDTMADGIIFNRDSISIYTDKALTEESKAEGSLHTESNISDKGFTLDFDMLSIKEKFPTLEEFYIYYTGTVTDDAFTYDYANNTVNLTYSNNPYDSESYGKDEATVYGYTFDIDVMKTSGDGVSPLANAVFGLYESVTNPSTNTTTETQIYLTQSTDDTLTVPTYHIGDGSASDTAGVITTDSTGAFNIVGLDDAKTYVLKEIQAPNGYNEAAPITFVITANYSQVNGIPTPTIEASGIGNDLSITVVNTSASLLPSTGGIGTTVFTMAGAAIMMGALVLLVLKKKKEHN